MTTAYVELPRGYAPAVDAAIKARPALDPLSAVKEFVSAKYGAWIIVNLSDRFTIEMTSDRTFNVIFEEDGEAAEFVRRVGGRIV